MLHETFQNFRMHIGPSGMGCNGAWHPLRTTCRLPCFRSRSTSIPYVPPPLASVADGRVSVGELCLMHFSSSSLRVALSRISDTFRCLQGDKRQLADTRYRLLANWKCRHGAEFPRWPQLIADRCNLSTEIIWIHIQKIEYLQRVWRWRSVANVGLGLLQLYTWRLIRNCLKTK